MTSRIQMRFSDRSTEIFSDARVSVCINIIGSYGSIHNSLATVQEYKGIRQCITIATEQHCSRIQQWFLPFNDSEIAKLEMGFPRIYTLNTSQSTINLPCRCTEQSPSWEANSSLSDNCAFLGYYAESSGNFLPTFRDSWCLEVKNKKTPEIKHNSNLPCQSITCTLRHPKVQYRVYNRQRAELFYYISAVNTQQMQRPDALVQLGYTLRHVSAVNRPSSGQQGIVLLRYIQIVCPMGSHCLYKVVQIWPGIVA